VLLLKTLIAAVLLVIFLQDLKSRAVYWFLFPSLVILLAYLRFQHSFSWPDWEKSVSINIGFIALQLLFLTLYFSVRNKKLINITNELLGLGDILFLLSISFYLSVLNFLFFYIISLIGALLIWLTWQSLSTKKNKYIPLAGFQSLIFMLFLACDWWLRSFDLTNDTWLLNLIAK
jgi:hypothetical protein